jgi:uncharacterized membrane protein
MSIRQFFIAYGSAALVFLALDAVWLSTMAERLYRPAIGHLMMDKPAFGPAIVFYLMYLVGVVVFAVAPALASQRWQTALGLGALLGLICYATYDLTNQATLRDWPLRVTLVDLAWGTFVTAMAAWAGWRVAMAFDGGGR